ncbi:MAG TPA: GAF domain-containing sensor histidine kinase [Candidatus Limnocylindria bacterium]|nr:GAF domain-containing sensor histidine kinase [Candidatus Limnocylindria bacterium]
MTPVTKTSLHTASALEATRQAETLARLRRATFLLLTPCTLALAISVRVFGDTTPVRTLGLVGMLALTTVTHALVQQAGARRRAVTIAVVFVAALAAMVLCTLAESGEAIHVQMAALSAVTLGAAVLLPWGWKPQAIVSALVGTGYLCLPLVLEVDQHELAEQAYALFDVLALSVIGAWTLERQRRALFRERAQTQAVMAQQQALLDAGAELNASLDLDETVATIARVAERAFDVDTIALVLVDETRGVLRVAAVAGAPLEVDRATEQMEVPLAALAELVREIRARGVLCVPDALPDLAELFRDQFGIRASMYAAIEHEGALLGYLVFNYRRAGAAFDETDATLARGFATCCAIALAKGRLVTDLQRANRVKNEFVSTMSHELRTPLHVILGYADLLADVVTDPEGRRGIDRIQVASRELLELIEATLDINRLESGADPARLAPSSMSELWEELASEFSALPRGPEVALRWEHAPGVVALTDRRKLKIIVKNLVGNALKFTRTGEVVASVRREGDRCQVEVRDTGVGIPAEHLASVFEMFRQVDSSDRRSFGGVGLGLYIVRKLAEQLQATLEVQSAVGVGTTFTLSLPVASARAAAA